jgi:hypothetical protein
VEGGDMKGKHSPVRHILAASVLAGGGFAYAAAGGINGIWSDKDRKNTYLFLKNNEFKFQIEPYGKPIEGEGVWQFREGLCAGWATIRESLATSCCT